MGIGRGGALDREAENSCDWFEYHQSQVFIAGPNRARHHWAPLLVCTQPDVPMRTIGQQWGPMPVELLLAGLR